jgi:hypothetical protein
MRSKVWFALYVALACVACGGDGGGGGDDDRDVVGKVPTRKDGGAVDAGVDTAQLDAGSTPVVTPPPTGSDASVRANDAGVPGTTDRDAGPTTRPDAGSSATALLCDRESTDTTCEACQKQSCCTPLVACFQDDQCFDVVSCFEDCGSNTSCQQQCIASNPRGAALANQFGQCMNTSCARQCQ